MSSQIPTSEADFKHNFGKEPLAVGMHTSMKHICLMSGPNNNLANRPSCSVLKGGGAVTLWGSCAGALPQEPDAHTRNTRRRHHYSKTGTA